MKFGEDKTSGAYPYLKPVDVDWAPAHWQPSHSMRAKWIIRECSVVSGN